MFCTSHASSIETFHNDIVNACMSASKSTIPTTSTHTRSGDVLWDGMILSRFWEEALFY